MPLITDGFNYINTFAGRPLRIRYFTETIGSVWDDERTLAQSGNDFYTSGVVIEVNGKKGSSDAVLMEEGRLKYGDLKCFIGSGVDTTSGLRVFTLAFSGASSVEIVYQEILPGMHSPEMKGSNIYKLIYLREINTGSLY